MKNTMIEKQRRNTMNKRKCPICGTGLERDIKQGECDEYNIHCNQCGEYALSYEFYADFIDFSRPRVDLSEIAVYLSCCKRMTARSCICECEGTESLKYHCITVGKIKQYRKEARGYIDRA